MSVPNRRRAYTKRLSKRLHGEKMGLRQWTTRITKEAHNLGVVVLRSHADGVIVVGTDVNTRICKQNTDDLPSAVLGGKADGRVEPLARRGESEDVRQR